ncbi:hypothetical protein [Oscillibacter sp.]|uniref:hypothetical protein n=1 Tax=Oscillibacter sp. TaxID=1945593 RepID=UPI00289FBF1F|nr:hypothetical protein [Oscillibacter sp.]
MKRFAAIMSFVIIVSGMTACGAEEITYGGLNAEILEKNTELKGFVVKSLDEDGILGEKCYIGLENENIYYLYVNNETGEIKDLSYEDFVVGDEITVDVKSVENRYALASRIQLLTQRK